jgi:CHAD domain-containing protein
MKLDILGRRLTAEAVVTSALRTLAALRQLRRALRRSMGHEDYDPEVTHVLRVSARKAETALRLLRTAGVRLPGLRRRLRRLRRSCGPLRDADICRAGFLRWRPGNPEPGPAALAGALTHHHAEALRTFVEGAASRRGLAGEVRRVEHALPTHRPARVKKSRRLRRWLARQVEPWATAAPLRHAAEDQLHRLRIEAKKLRYLLDAAAGEHPDTFADTLGRLRQIHDHLGAVRDCQVILAWLDRFEEMLRRDPGEDVTTLRATLGAWRQQLGEEIETQVKKFEEFYEGTTTPPRLRLA